MRNYRLSVLITVGAFMMLALMTSSCIRGGRLEVRAVPNQAFVYLDGVPIGDAGRSRDHDILLNDISPGEHTVGVYNYGYKPEVQKVTITEGQTTHLRVPLTALPGTVSGPFGRIQIEGGDHAAVLLNGKTPEYLVGNADEFNNDWHWKQQLLVPPGTHELTVQNRGTTVWSGPVTVAAGQRLIVHVNREGAQTTASWPEGQTLNNLPRFQAGIASATVAVAAPKAQISASSAQIDCGGSARLTWSSSDAVTGGISGLGEVPASGDREVQPKENTTYTYSVSGPGGKATASATVNVNKAIQASLEVSPAEISYQRTGEKVSEQGSATIKWSTSNADSVTLEPFGKVDPSGSRTVQAEPKQTAVGSISETTTYTLNASNACGGSETRTATLRVTGTIKPAVTEASLETFLASVYFPTAYPTKNKADVGLLASQRQSLTQFAAALKRYLQDDPSARLRLEGNADDRGPAKYNMALSERRVEIVKQFLISQGIPAAAIDTQAFGLTDNLDREAVRQLEERNPNPPTMKMVGRRARVDWLAHNRRVDIVLLPSGISSARFYPYNAGDFKILWQAPRPALRVVEKAQ
jgi:outer membrane protein OmpA-like peptidoglycan-associated protein